MNVNDILTLSEEIIRLVGMTPDGLAIVDHYPKGGKGGEGIQVYQPLYESWLIISTWPTYGFVRVNLSSCKPFDPDVVGSFLIKKIGPIQKSWSNVI